MPILENALGCANGVVSSQFDPNHAVEQEFQVNYDLKTNVSWLILTFVYSLYKHDINKKTLENNRPFALALHEVDKSRNYKRGDFYGFSPYHTYCEHHAWCETKVGVPMHTQAIDHDVARLIEKGEQIAKMLGVVEIPGALGDCWLVSTLKKNNLAEVVGKPYELIPVMPERGLISITMPK